VHRVRKFVEVAQRPDRYAMTASTLSDVSNGRKWNPDIHLNVCDAIMEDSRFASVQSGLESRHVMSSGDEAKGK